MKPPLTNLRLARPIVLLLALLLGVAGCGATGVEPPGGDADGVDDTGDAVSDLVKDDRVTLVGIADGDVLSGRVSLSVELSGRVGQVRGVEFHVDGSRVDTVLLEPFATSLDTAAFGDGDHVVSVLVARVDGSPIETGAAVRFDNTGPTVALTSPANGSSLFAAEAMRLDLEASDVSGVRDLAVTVNGLPVAVSGPPWSATFGLSDLSLGEADLPLSLLIGVTATDEAGQRTLATFGLTLRSRLAFRFRTLGEVWAPPVVAGDGTAYVGSRDGFVYAVRADGSEKWRADVGAEIVTSPALFGGGDVVVSAGSRVVALSQADGHELWAYPAPATVGSGPAVGPGAIYAGTYANSLVAINPANGAELWAFPTGNAVLSTPVVDGTGTVIFGSTDGNVYGVTAAGAEAWRFPTGDAVWSSPRLAADGDILVGSNDGYLYRLNRYGSFRWEFEARGEVWGAAAEAADGTVYVASTYRRLYALSPQGGHRWEVDYLSGFSYATPAIAADGTVLVVSTDGTLHALAPDRTELWSFTADGGATGAVVLSPDGSLAWFGSNDRHLYAVHTGIDGGCGAPEMVDVGTTRIMRYEASRADATPDSPGTSAETVCSRPGALPWTQVTWQEAQAACSMLGLQLCTGTVWTQACQGPGGADFPYGTTYDPAACNGSGFTQDGCASGGCGALATGEASACASALGGADLSGNVREWTLDAQPGGYLVRGGGFRDAGDDLRCSNTFPATHVVAGSTRADDLGFRCCSIP